ncbi:MAG: ATP-binding protein [Armatimonadota bacterium]
MIKRSLTIKSIRGVLYLMLFIVILPAMLAHVVQNVRAFRGERERAMRVNATAARGIAMAFHTYINEVRHNQQTFGVTYASLDLPAAERNVLLAKIARENPTWRGIYWADPSGVIRAASRPELIGRSVRDQGLFQTIAGGRESWAMSGLLRDRITGEPSFVVAQGIRNRENRLLGACMVQVDPRRLDALYPLRQAAGSRFFLVDRSGMLVYRQPHLTVDWPRRQVLERWPFLQRVLQGEEVTGTMRGMDGERRIFAATPVPSCGWAAVASYPEQAVMAPVREQLLRNIVFFLLLFTTAFFVGLIVSRYVTRPLELLREYAHHVAHGELDRRVAVGGPAELAALANALNGMTVELQERTAALEQERKHAQALAAREARYSETLRVLIDTVPAGIIECDREGEIILMNPVASELLDTEVSGGTIFDDSSGFTFYSAEGSPLPLAETPMPRALTQGTVTRDLEIRVHCPGGEEVILLTSAGPICDGGRITGAVAVFQDITPLHQLQEERELFIHTISHDLRLPISIVQGHAQVLAEEVAAMNADGMLKNGLDAILRAAGRMNVMIQDLVDSARLAGRTLELRTEPVALRAYLENLLQRAAAGLEVERIRLEVPDDLPPVRADYARLERIMVNLLSNALKYSPPEAPVTVSACREGDEMIVSVTDRGIGIAPEDLPNIFARFYRARGSRRTEGIGLGLYITRQLVEAHGGRIWVESEPGKRSTFSFTLQLA